MKTNLTADEIRALAQSAAENDYHLNAGMERTAEIKEWRGARQYINVKCYTLAGRLVKTYDLGYIDMESGEYVVTKYTDFDLTEMIEAEEARIAAETETAETETAETETAETETIEAETETAETESTETESTLHGLTGSEKQIRWAEDIRAKALEQIRAFFAKSNPGRLDELDRRMAQLVEVLPQDAAWWIDNRLNFPNAQVTMRTVAAVMPRK